MLLRSLLSTLLLLLLSCCLTGHRLNVLQQLRQPVLGRLVILQTSCESFVLELIRQTLAKRFAGARVVAETQVAAHDVLEKPLLRFLG